MSTEFTSDDALKLLRHAARMPTPIQKAETKAAGNRLRRFRLALAQFKEEFSFKTLRTFADKTGIDEDNLNNWELGRALVPNYYVKRLKDKFGISYLFEWIYGNDSRGLPLRLTEGMPPPDNDPTPTVPEKPTKIKAKARKKRAS